MMNGDMPALGTIKTEVNSNPRICLHLGLDLDLWIGQSVYPRPFLVLLSAEMQWRCGHLKGGRERRWRI
jgi:hypothetical protein